MNISRLFLAVTLALTASASRANPDNYHYSDVYANVGGNFNHPASVYVQSLGSNAPVNTVDTGIIDEGRSIYTLLVDAYASADIVNAKVHARAGVISSYGSGQTGGSSAGARIVDTLYFVNPNAHAGDITKIDYSVHVDGVLREEDGYVPCTSCAGLPGAYLHAGVRNSNYSNTGLYGFHNILEEFHCCGNSVITVNNNLAGWFSFEGPTGAIPIQLELTGGAQFGQIDFGNTASFTFNTLPTGVSYTSASGMFLAAGVPEPSSWAMILVGFGGLGLALRRKIGRDKSNIFVQAWPKLEPRMTVLSRTGHLG